MLHILLTALVMGQWVASMWPAMWLWGLNTRRFTPAPWGWVLASLCALSLLPPAGRFLVGCAGRLGDLIIVHFWFGVALGLLLATTVLAVDDRTWVTGDFLLRSGVPGTFLQSLPLETFVFERLPRALLPVIGDVLVFTRAIGAVSAFTIGLAAAMMARALARRGTLAFAIWCVVALGGHLATMTGLGKPAGLLGAATALVGLLAIRAIRGRRAFADLAALGFAAAAAVLLHRGGLLLMPCWLWATVEVLRRAHLDGTRRRPLFLLGVFAPVLALATVGVDIVRIFFAIDLPHHIAGPSFVGQPVPWTSGGSTLHVLDLLNLVALLVPVGLPLLIAGAAAFHRVGPRRSMGPAVALAAPWLLAMLIIHPSQGVFRDLDVFAPGGVALALLCACLVETLFGDSRRFDYLLVPTALISLSASLQLLLCFHSPTSGLARVEAYVSEPPNRSENERAWIWDFMALRAVRVGDWPMARRASGEAVRYAPSPRLLLTLGIANMYVGDYSGARTAYSATLERAPNEPLAWTGLAGAAACLGDSALADSAFRRVDRFIRREPARSQINDFISGFPEVMRCPRNR